MLVAALVEHFDRHGAVLDLVRGPGVQANIDAAGGEGRDVGDENEDVTDELRVGAPRERVENTGDTSERRGSSGMREQCSTNPERCQCKVRGSAYELTVVWQAMQSS